MAKGSGGPFWPPGPCVHLEISEERTVKKASAKKGQGKGTTKAVIASRRSCKAKGTGLSHYVLMDRKAK
jgi:modified peptide precursor CbpA